jgi:orotidine-5'-phosphate decarboxylase|tara:strand:+ start:5470 stop:6147 length:678 start_codon:yes stop_codon:yes gene_type:complete
MKNKKIFVACDISSQEETLNLLDQIHEDIDGIKIGLQYITQRSPDDIRELTKYNKPIFYDGKFLDIKTTLTASIAALESLNVDYATVHLLNGLDSLKSANEVAKKINVNLLGVSVLTSFSNTDLINLGFKDDIKTQVERLIKIASEASLFGVVSSPLEVKMIKKISPQLKCFTPGIRMTPDTHDQKRTMNANESIKAGSDCLIIGRPITDGDPKKNIKYILSSIE